MFKSVNVKPSTKEKIKLLSDRYDLKLVDFMDTIVDFFYENKTIVNADFFKKSEKGNDKLLSKLDRSFERIARKESNRIIGFLKVQDKYMKSMKKDIIYTFSEGEIEDYHPLFIDYNFLISIYKEILYSKGLVNDSKILEYILKELGKEEFDNFIESEEKIKEKKLFIDL